MYANGRSDGSIAPGRSCLFRIAIASGASSAAPIARRSSSVSGLDASTTNSAASQSFAVPALGFLQLNLANHLGISNFNGGSAVVSCSTPGCLVAAYASVIDATTADPRTILAR